MILALHRVIVTKKTLRKLKYKAKCSRYYNKVLCRFQRRLLGRRKGMLFIKRAQFELYFEKEERLE